MVSDKNRVALIALLTLLFSCSIVKDSDITSIKQLDGLTLKSFEIAQNFQTGSSSALATLKYDSVVNRISAATGAHVTRIKGFNLPALGTNKIKFKSGTNAVTLIRIGYTDKGRPNVFAVFQGDSLVEQYKFFYNSKDQLLKLVVDLDPVDNKPEILHIKDSVIYPTTPGNYPSSIIRKSSDASLVGTFEFQTCTGCNSSGENISPIVFNQSIFINFNSGGNNCNSSNNYPWSCGGVNKTGNSGNNGNGNQTQLSFQNNFTFDKTLQTFLTSQSNTDYYYFHPIMILKDLVPSGSLYFWFYSYDWFVTSNGPVANSDKVTLNLNYGK